MSEAINDGGPAFPIPGLQEDPDFNGMTLRDYFAAKAMQALLNAISQSRGEAGDFRDEVKPLSEMSFYMADAMLRAREPK